MFKILAFLSGVSSLTFAFNLAIDVGHSDKRSGAQSATCEKEYNYNLGLSKHLIESLKDEKNLKVESNFNKKNTTFKERYKLSKNKDLFISIHHDSVQTKYIKYTKKRCPQTSFAKGYSIFISKKNVDYKKSLYYAKILSRSLLKSGLKPTLHHNEPIKGENRELIDKELGIYRFDNLLVLKNTKSPALLFEAGVIVNPIDEKLVKTIEYKNIISNGIKNIINKGL